MHHAIRLGATIVLAVLAMSGADAATTWSDVDCKDADLGLGGGFKCRKSSDFGSGDAALSQHVTSVFGNVDGLHVSAALFVLGTGGVYSAYGVDMSERVVRAYANASKPAPENWGTYRGFGGTGYLTFRRSGRDCVGFDHAGPAATVHGASGYSYILRGYFCEEGGIANPEARLRQLLAAFRVGGPGSGKNAFGEPVVTLARSEPRPAGPASAAAVPAPASQPSRTVPIAMSWEGVSNLALGTMRYTGTDAGEITLDLAEGGGKCIGTWRLLTTQAGTAPQTGTWAISCPNGQAASGTYRATETGKGAGEGVDAHGRKISIKYGG